MNLAKQGDQEQIAVALDKYGFAGYTVDQVVAEGKLRARRFVEDILELGRIVLACRELPRGMYGAAIAQMGISNDTARRVAGVALKFWNRDHLKPLLTLDTSKVYELALLDDASLANIAEDPEAIDDIDRMSVSELRASLREAKDEILAKDAVAQDLQNTIRKQKEKIARTPAPTQEFLAEEALSLLDQEALQCAAALTTTRRGDRRVWPYRVLAVRRTRRCDVVCRFRRTALRVRLRRRQRAWDAPSARQSHGAPRIRRAGARRARNRSAGRRALDPVRVFHERTHRRDDERRPYLDVGAQRLPAAGALSDAVRRA
ncbi:hypothetical protein [Burkholderia glumae]|uniref:hypothetical protein n=1 Tax=Burkholderia glumae TaxID=337 RepID=UPI0040633BD1